MTPEPLLPGMRPDLNHTEVVARAVFCARCGLVPDDFDGLLEGDPMLAKEFDATMDEIAADPLVDDDIDCSVPNIFMDMHDSGLVNPRPVKLVRGVRIVNLRRPSPYGEIS